MSNRLKGLRETASDFTSKMETMLATASDAARDLTAEERTAYGALETGFAQANDAVKREQRLIEAKAANATAVGDVALPALSAARVMPRYGKLKAFTASTFGTKAEAETAAHRTGMWIRGAILKDEGARAWCLENGMQFIRAAAGQSETINTAGGFLVPQEFSQAIIDLRESYGTFRQFAQIVPMGRDSVTFPRRLSGTTAAWYGENAQLTASTKAWDQVFLVAKKLGGLSLISSELAEDAIINIADDLAQEFGYQFAIAEDAAGWNGDGTSTYGSITGVRVKLLQASSAGSLYQAASGHNTFATLDATDLTSCMGKLPKYALRNAKWYVSQVGFSVTFSRLVAAAGGNTIDSLSGAVHYQYLGYPIVIDQTLPTVLTTQASTVMAVFGDLGMAAMMGERRGINVKVSDDRYFEFDQTGIMATERVDINVHDTGTATAAGPIIGLQSAA